MRGLSAVLVLTALGACAAHGGVPPQRTPSRAIGRTMEPSPAQRTYGVRSVTWSEYYSEVAERARRKGMLVVWINPPSVR